MALTIRKPFAPSASQSSRSRRVVKTQALFGWGKKNKEYEDEKEDQWRAQQEVLAKRRSGDAIKEANSRRQQVADTLRSRKEERQREKDSLAQGIMPDTLKNWKPYSKETEDRANSGVVVPLFPFGIRKYDDGERFDLRLPYADDGWVDPDETDAWSGFKKLFSFGKKEAKEDDGQPKKIIWASQYGKYQAEQKAKKANKGGK